MKKWIKGIMLTLTALVGFGCSPSISSSMIEDLNSLGLTTNLKLVLDAGDITSYSSGQSWLDKSGGGYDFYLGVDGTVTATDPTHNNTNFSVDGGDYFTYDSANETWMDALGKTGAVSFLAVVYIPSNTVTHIFATAASGVPGSFGMSFGYEPAVSNKFVFRTTNTAVGYNALGSAGPDVSASLPGLFLVGFSRTIDGAGNVSYIVHVNGTNYTASGTITADNASSPVNGAKILTNGDTTETAPNNTRIYSLAVWQGTQLSTTDYTNIWNKIRSKYGL